MFHLIKHLILLALIAGAILYFWLGIKNPADLQKAYDQALEQAKSYSPPEGTFCTQMITKAINEATGAEYTFPNGCIPEGWKIR